MATAADSEPIAPFAYAISFLVSIVLVKITIAYFFSKAQVNLSSDKGLPSSSSHEIPRALLQ